MRRILFAVLQALGVGQVFQCDSGAKALQLLRHERPDLIISDWQMAPMDGIEMTELIRNDPRNPARLVPIILMTGYSSHDKVVAARDRGVTEFLVKPFSAEALAKRIAHVIKAPRDFVAAPAYQGPDRRRRPTDGYKGPDRRQDDYRGF
jgi:CheY-like chemotaxis protein